MKNRTALLIGSVIPALVFAMTLTGCVSPLSTENAAIPPIGSVSVVAFDYLPAKSGDVSPNHAQGREAWHKPNNSSIYFDKNVDVLVREALIAKLPSVGVKVDSPDKKLSGEIEAFGYVRVADFALRIKYRVTVGTTVAYESVKEVSRKRESTFAPEVGLDDLVDLSILELTKDPAFLSAIK